MGTMLGGVALGLFLPVIVAGAGPAWEVVSAQTSNTHGEADHPSVR
jgi:hypothetical protein